AVSPRTNTAEPRFDAPTKVSTAPSRLTSPLAVGATAGAAAGAGVAAAGAGTGAGSAGLFASASFCAVSTIAAACAPVSPFGLAGVVAAAAAVIGVTLGVAMPGGW